MDTFPIAEKIYLGRISDHVQGLAAAYLLSGGRLIYDDGELDDEDVRDMITPALVIFAEVLLFHTGERDANTTAFLFVDHGHRPGALPLEMKMSRHRRPMPIQKFLEVVTEVFEVQMISDAVDLRRFINRARQNLPCYPS